ncbi:unnamed protein product [Toxocara canis]|uniref:Phospholipid scramblase n=1 Tax=Toxocara canis TaxID=6265 RepID=A0A183UKY9_TOXCA|nr:unnamed protein product [Toxocara canis]
MRIPFELFSQQQIEPKQRQILDFRLNDLLPPDESLYLSSSIFVDMHIDEHFLLFTCNRSVLVDVFNAMSSSQVMLAQVITNEHDVSLVAVSVVRGRFSVPRLLSAICTRECRRQFWADGEYCRMKCAEKQVLFIVYTRQNRISIVGSMKHDWQNFLRFATVDNIRRKYATFIEPSIPQQTHSDDQLTSS